jgi:hypothetical protein
MRRIAILGGRQFKIALLGIGLSLLVAGCASMTRPPDVYQVELHRSASQTLVLVNNYAGPIKVHAYQGDGIIQLDPGDAREIEFVVVTLADMSPSEAGPWYAVRNNRFNFVQESSDARYLKASGTDLIMDVVMTDGRPDPLLLSLQNCPFQGWEDASAEKLVHSVTFPGMAGTPQRVCPR